MYAAVNWIIWHIFSNLCSALDETKTCVRILTDLAGNDQPKHMWHSVRCIIYSRVTKNSAEGVEHVSSLAGIQLFRERLSEKGHATILKGIVDGFLFTVFQKNFQRTAREAMNVCLRMLKESNKVGSTATVSGTVYWSYPKTPFGIVACTVFLTTFLEITVCWTNVV